MWVASKIALGIGEQMNEHYERKAHCRVDSSTKGENHIEVESSYRTDLIIPQISPCASPVVLNCPRRPLSDQRPSRGFHYLTYHGHLELEAPAK
jgi:hypothetical protein